MWCLCVSLALLPSISLHRRSIAIFLVVFPLYTSLHHSVGTQKTEIICMFESAKGRHAMSCMARCKTLFCIGWTYHKHQTKICPQTISQVSALRWYTIHTTQWPIPLWIKNWGHLEKILISEQPSLCRNRWTYRWTPHFSLSWTQGDPKVRYQFLLDRKVHQYLLVNPPRMWGWKSFEVWT